MLVVPSIDVSGGRSRLVYWPGASTGDGGSVNLDTIRGLRDASIAGIILGEPLLSGALDFATALETAS